MSYDIMAMLHKVQKKDFTSYKNRWAMKLWNWKEPVLNKACTIGYGISNIVQASHVLKCLIFYDCTNV